MAGISAKKIIKLKKRKGRRKDISAVIFPAQLCDCFPQLAEEGIFDGVYKWKK